MNASPTLLRIYADNVRRMATEDLQIEVPRLMAIDTDPRFEEIVRRELAGR